MRRSGGRTLLPVPGPAVHALTAFGQVDRRLGLWAIGDRVLARCRPCTWLVPGELSGHAAGSGSDPREDAVAWAEAPDRPYDGAWGRHVRQPGLVRRAVPGLLAACLLATAAGSMRAAEAEEVRENEALVMRLVFKDCLGFLRHGRTPFEGLATRPAPEAVRTQFPAAMPDRNQIIELLSPRYAAAWGGNAGGRHCIVMTVLDPWPPPGPGLLGVRPAGFVARVTARAAAAGLRNHPAPDEAFSPLSVTTWGEPETGHEMGPLRPIRVVIMPTSRSEDGRVMDVGSIVAAGPP